MDIVQMHADNWPASKVAGHALTLLKKQGTRAMNANGSGCVYSSLDHPNRCAVGLLLPDYALMAIHKKELHWSVGNLADRLSEYHLLPKVTNSLKHYLPILKALQRFHDNNTRAIKQLTTDTGFSEEDLRQLYEETRS
ncbi:hypothetical protein [Kineobactrum salinum]|uniref:Uncharacterized protein n=1 Tax=Kineobactrum salinum TaxID=2708301 RepID=A0A6C0U736_9GAMM|nr:hypothetical protein [Kineobactrum salinum]QIB67149.1 hypothetical protein G3T16_18830 [Kineobactrum salinum]